MVKINVLGNDRSKPPETSSGRALTAWYLARALGADGPLDVPETCDIAVAVDDPSLLGTVEAKRYYLWVTTTAVDLRAVRRWVGNGRGKIVVAASERVKAHARRVGLSVRCIVPLGACGTFAAAARDPDLRRNVYLADDEWGAATVRGIEAFGVAHERVAGLRLTVLGTGERSPELVEALRRLPDDAVTVAEAPLAHSAMPAAVGGQGILVHLPIGAERGLAVREALVAGGRSCRTRRAYWAA